MASCEVGTRISNCGASWKSWLKTVGLVWGGHPILWPRAWISEMRTKTVILWLHNGWRLGATFVEDLYGCGVIGVDHSSSRPFKLPKNGSYDYGISWIYLMKRRWTTAAFGIKRFKLLGPSSRELSPSPKPVEEAVSLKSWISSGDEVFIEERNSIQRGQKKLPQAQLKLWI